jgi:DNA polymerase III epsilon subunit-like protein
MKSVNRENDFSASTSLLFFDTETTGVPRNYSAPISDVDNWPRLIQIGWALFDIDGTEIDAIEYVIKPDGFIIPEAASKIHGITTAIAKEKGIKLQDALSKFSDAVLSVPILVGHNIAFDENIIGSEFLRCNMENVILLKQRMCTMKLSVNFCKLPGSYGYKWPKLNELYKILFHSEMGRSHNALADARATAKCFFQLKKLGVINY